MKHVPAYFCIAIVVSNVLQVVAAGFLGRLPAALDCRGRTPLLGATST